jgi:hypothetical protein
MFKSNTIVPLVSRESMAANGSATPAVAKSAPAYDAEKDHISTLLLELGQANAIVDLLFMVACEDQADSMCNGTLESSLHTVLMRLSAVKNAAEALLGEKIAH